MVSTKRKLTSKSAYRRQELKVKRELEKLFGMKFIKGSKQSHPKRR